jgi:hypothetical protein
LYKQPSEMSMKRTFTIGLVIAVSFSLMPVKLAMATVGHTDKLNIIAMEIKTGMMD